MCTFTTKPIITSLAGLEQFIASAYLAERGDKKPREVALEVVDELSPAVFRDYFGALIDEEVEIREATRTDASKTSVREIAELLLCDYLMPYVYEDVHDTMHERGQAGVLPVPLPV